MSAIETVLSAIHLTNHLAILIVVGLIFITALYKIVGKVVINPILDHVEQRESATAGALFSAGQMRAKAEALNVRYQDALFQARVDGNKERMKLVGKAKDEASAIIAQAERDAAQKIQNARDNLSAQVVAARAVAEGESLLLADMLTSRVDRELSSH